MPSKTGAPASVLLMEGQEFYNAKKYEEAISSFSVALKTGKDSRADLIHVLDLRMATYLKLGKRDLAMQDAKSMIRQDVKDGRGYLRCIQLELLTDNFDAAVKWCEHGLKNVNERDRLHERLQNQISKVRELKAGKAIFMKPADPMANLPMEVVQMILAYFDYKQVVGMLRVCRAWKNLFSVLKPLVDTVDFSKTKKIIKYSAMKAALLRARAKTKVLKVCQLDQAAAKAARTSLERWGTYTDLEHLQVNSAHFSLRSLRLDKFDLRSLILGNETSMYIRDVISIVKKTPNLRTAKFLGLQRQETRDSVGFYSFDGWPLHLEELEVALTPLKSSSQEHDDLFEMAGIKHLVNMNTFVCKGFVIRSKLTDPVRGLVADLTSCTSLVELDVSECDFVAKILLPESLKALTCRDTRFHYDPGERYELPKGLVKLDAFGSSLAQGHLPFRLPYSESSNLEEFAIDLDRYLGYPIWSHVFDGVYDVRLKYGYMRDEDSVLLLRTFPRLSSITLESMRITGLFLKDLFSKLDGQLQNVTLKDCLSIPNDAVEWLRSEGVCVEVQKTPERSGRRVRLE